MADFGPAGEHSRRICFEGTGRLRASSGKSPASRMRHRKHEFQEIHQVFSWFDPCFVNRSGEFSQERLAWLLRQRPNLPAEDRNRLSSALSAGATTADLTEPRRGRRPLFIPQRDFTRTWVWRFRPTSQLPGPFPGGIYVLSLTLRKTL